mmetsp:Transcript_28742/g.66767  ORF Transcript_28742/g.66767 Transcript_28742/m.66767 type:complete len:247 (-) Transcript_28742:1101-1841(-)
MARRCCCTGGLISHWPASGVRGARVRTGVGGSRGRSPFPTPLIYTHTHGPAASALPDEQQRIVVIARFELIEDGHLHRLVGVLRHARDPQLLQRRSVIPQLVSLRVRVLANDQVFDEAVSSRELFFDREEVRRGLELHVKIHKVPVHEVHFEGHKVVLLLFDGLLPDLSHYVERRRGRGLRRRRIATALLPLPLLLGPCGVVWAVAPGWRGFVNAIEPGTVLRDLRHRRLSSALGRLSHALWPELH